MEWVHYLLAALGCLIGTIIAAFLCAKLAEERDYVAFVAVIYLLLLNLAGAILFVISAMNIFLPL